MAKLKKFLSFLLIFSMIFSFSTTHVKANNDVTTEIDYSDVGDGINQFKYNGGLGGQYWNVGSANSHSWTKGTINSETKENYWYEVRFYGKKIDIYAQKNHPMGKVEYIIDGNVRSGEVDLYSRRATVQKVYTFDNLSEGEHTLRAIATGNKNVSATKDDRTISAGKVVVYRSSVVATEINFDRESYTLTQGEEVPFTIVSTPNQASVSQIEYTVQNPEVLSVREGNFVGLQPGETTVVATSGNLTTTTRVSVSQAQPFLGGSIVNYDKQYTNEKYEMISLSNKVSDTITTWKNDQALSMLGLYTKGLPINQVRITATDLIGENGETIPATAVEKHFIKSTKAYVGRFLGYGSKERVIPVDNGSNRKESSDILYQQDEIDTIQANQVQPVMLKFAIPKDATPGIYTTNITVQAEGIQDLTFTYNIRVLDATLHDSSEFSKHFDVELWQYPYRTAEYYNVEPFSQAHFEILKPMLELYKSVGGDAITTTLTEDSWNGQTYSKNPKNGIHYPSMIKWIKEDGVMKYDYTDFEKWISFAKQNGLGKKVVVYSMAPWHNSFTYWENGTLRKETFNSTNYSPMWTHFFKDFVRYLDEKGWSDSIYIGFDERNFDIRAFSILESIKTSSGKPLKTTAAMDRFRDKMEIAKQITDLTIGDFAAQEDKVLFDQLVAERDGRGLKTTLYSCTEHQPGNFSLSAPVESYWSVINAGKQTTGFLRWAYDAWVENPLEDATHNAFEPGDPFIVYPGDANNGNKVRSSVRLERIAEAIRDMNKIKLMVSKVPSLQEDVDVMYSKISTVARKNRDSYMTDSQINTLSNEMTVFKQDLEALTLKYLELVRNGTNDIESITLEDRTIAVGEVFALSPSVLPENTLNKNVTYTISNPKLLSVDAKGNFTALRRGKVQVTATSIVDTTKQATATITIINKTVSSEGEVAYYSFNEENGNDSWNGRHGTAIGSVSYVDGEYGKAAKLTQDSHFVLPDNDVLNTDSNWTVSYHFKLEQMPTTRTLIMANKNLTQGAAVRLDAQANRNAPGYRVGSRSGDVLTYNKYSYRPNQWYHVVWTQDREKGLTKYVNGQKVETNTWPTRSRGNTIEAPIELIGKGFEGYIDEVKIYNRVLTDAERKVLDRKDGLVVNESMKELEVEKNYEIDAEVYSQEDLQIVYSSNNEEVASVNQEGIVRANKLGSATITITAGAFIEKVQIHVIKKHSWHPSVPRLILNPKYTKILDSRPDEQHDTGRYLGQPDMVKTKTGRLIIAYPKGHGKGPVIMQISDDDGESWKFLNNTPSSWIGSQETPTLYKLQLENGTERLLMINSNPGWGTDSAGFRYGWNTSYSDDNGETWTEYRNWYPTISNRKNNDAIVAMASLVQLKDESGNFIQKWMGVYHTNEFINYKTYLTFNENGEEQWSAPEPYLSQHRDIEQSHQICEVGIFRSPDGNRLVALARTQAHNNLATMFYSDDEGITWTRPVHLPASLAGERHKIAVDPISKRLVVTFREIVYDTNNNNVFEGGNDWRAGEWLAWVGSYEQLMNLEEGDYNIELAKDYAPTRYSGDTGYTGIATSDDGTFVMVTYGHWNEEESKKYINHSSGRGVYYDLVEIKQAKFKLGNIENENQLVDKSELNRELERIRDLNAAIYTDESLEMLEMVKLDAENVLQASDSQQIQVDTAVKKLKNASMMLIEKTANYEKVDEAIEKANALTQDLYVSFEGVSAALEAVDRTKKITDQEAVDAYAAAIEEAIATLQRKAVTLSDNNVTIEVATPKATFPTTPVFKAEKLDKALEGYDKANLALYDLTINKEEGYAHTDATVIKLPIEAGKTVEKAIYVNAYDTVVELPFTVENEYAVINVEHFSVYGLVYAAEQPTVEPEKPTVESENSTTEKVSEENAQVTPEKANEEVVIKPITKVETPKAAKQTAKEMKSKVDTSSMDYNGFVALLLMALFGLFVARKNKE